MNRRTLYLVLAIVGGNLVGTLIGWAICFAHDWEKSEGRFHNRADETFYCYTDDRNHPDVLCRRSLLKDQMCYGDALGTGDGAPVFKIPNRTDFLVDSGPVITPSNRLSWLMLDTIRRLRKGKYGWMNWAHFIKIMGGKPVVDCNE